MSDKKKDLLNWYYENEEDVAEQMEITLPTTSDLNPVPATSPQADIQKEILNKVTQPELTQKNDAVIAVDKMNAYKAYGILKVIEEKLKMFSVLAGTQMDDPMKKEGLANDLKSLSRELADIIGAL